MSVKNVFVTGATGFVGTAFLEALSSCFDVKITALYRSTRGRDFSNVEWLRGDLNDPAPWEKCVDGADVIVHLAAKVSYLASDRKELFKVNVEGTRNLLNLALLGGVRRFMYMSSASTLHRSADPFMVKEDYLGIPKLYTSYARSKYLAELECWRAQAEGLEIKIFNPAFIVGESRDWGSSMIVFKRIAEGLSFYPKGNLGVIDLKDVCEILLQALGDNDWNTQQLLVAESMSWEAFIHKISSAMKMDKKRSVLKDWQQKLLSLYSMCFPSPTLNPETLRITALPIDFDFESMSLHKRGFPFSKIDSTIRRIVG